MKLYFLVIAGFIATALSGPAPGIQDIPEDDGANMKYFLVETSPGVYKVEDLVTAQVDTRATQSDLTYHFFSQRDVDVGVNFKSTDIVVLKDTQFSVSRNTVIVIHGWQDSSDADLNIYVKEAILTHHNVNLFVVDWAPIASKNYISARYSVGAVGQYVASFINSLVDGYGLRLSTVTIIGFSLGAHIAGNAGAVLNGQVDHIVGLDPAGPLFSVSNINDRLDPTDAQFVHVIHANGGFLGFKNAVGHADYYPNGGSSQPGCGLDITGICSHTRVFRYYAESILATNSNFVATQCSSYNDYNRGRCSGNPTSLLGGYSVDKSARGDYYLNTNNQSPFAKN